MIKTYLKILKIIAFLFLIAVLPLNSKEEEPKQIKVYVGIYVNQIFALSLRDNQFSADFYIWFRWKGGNIDPIKTFELANGRIESRENEATEVSKGYNYSYCRVVATIQKFWDIRKFPLDNHVLTFEIEDSAEEEDTFIYIADKENCGLNPKIQVPGWKIDSTDTKIVQHLYNTSYGDPSLPSNNESVYSQFNFSINIIRPGIGYFLKLFFGVFIAALLSFLVFFLKPTDLDPRFGLGVGAIFAAVASEYVIASSLPDTNILTLADKLHIVAFSFIFFSIAESILSLAIYTKGKEKLSRILDICCFFTFSALYAALTVIFVFN